MCCGDVTGDLWSPSSVWPVNGTWMESWRGHSGLCDARLALDALRTKRSSLSFPYAPNFWTHKRRSDCDSRGWNIVEPLRATRVEIKIFDSLQRMSQATGLRHLPLDTYKPVEDFDILNVEDVRNALKIYRGLPGHTASRSRISGPQVETELLANNRLVCIKDS